MHLISKIAFASVLCLVPVTGWAGSHAVKVGEQCQIDKKVQSSKDCHKKKTCHKTRSFVEINGIKISHYYVKPPMKGQDNAVAYVRLQNNGQKQDALIAAASPVAEKTELHHHHIDDKGVAVMHDVKEIALPVGEKLVLQPKSYHIMLINLQQSVKPCKPVPVTLHFKNAGPITLGMPVMKKDCHKKGQQCDYKTKQGHENDHKRGHDYKHDAEKSY